MKIYIIYKNYSLLKILIDITNFVIKLKFKKYQY